MKIRNRVFLYLTVIFALLPPTLVVADRWLGIIPPHILSSIWCRSDFLCSTVIPSYFLIIFGCTLVLPFLVFLLQKHTVTILEQITPREDFDEIPLMQLKLGLVYQVVSIGFMLFFTMEGFWRQALPGWGMIYAWLGFMAGAFISYIPGKTVRRSWEKNGEKWLAILLAHAGLVGLLVGIYGKPDLLWATAALAVLTGANLWRFRREVPAIFWVMSLALVVFTIDINGWWTSVVGDEFIFHEIAWRMSDILNYQELEKILFRADGAHSTHTYFSSLFQVLSMKFFGSESFGWRFSNPYQCSLAVGLFYYFCSTFISKRQSLTAAFLFSISSCVMAFSKIGYNNLQALFGLTLVLALAAWIIRSGSRLSYLCMGYALAFCFYAYPAALYAIPLPLILMVVYHPPRDREAIKNWVWMLSICLLLITPLMMQPVYWTSKITGTTLNQPVIFESINSITSHFGLNFLFAFYSFLYTFYESHFIVASYLDPLTGFFFLIGLSVLLFQARRQRFPLFVLFMFIYFLLVIGTTHDRNHPPHTRMFMLIPVYALISSWGVSWLGAQITRIRTFSRNTTRSLQVTIALGLIGLNLYQAYPLSHERYADVQSIETVFVQLSQRIEQAEPRQSKNYVIIADKDWGISGFLMMQKAYPHLAWAEMHEIQLSEPVLPEDKIPLLSERNTIIILMPWMDQEWVRALNDPLKDLGKKACELTTFSGSRLTTMFYSPDLPQACAP